MTNAWLAWHPEGTLSFVKCLSELIEMSVGANRNICLGVQKCFRPGSTQRSCYPYFNLTFKCFLLRVESA